MSFLINIINKFKTSLDENTKSRLNKIQSLQLRWLQHFIFRLFFGSNLKILSTIYGTDKWGFHWYAQHYEKHFASIRKKRMNILEIGIGGYSDPESGGDSLRVWRTYFPKSNIYGIDIYDKSIHQERRIKTFIGSQTDEMFLSNVVKKIDKINIIIDDGSHQNEHVLFTFSFLFPYLQENGFYVIEDTQTSYWPEFGGSSENMDSNQTTMGFLKNIIHGLNYIEYKKINYEPNYYDKNIMAIHFYHNIVFIQKGINK